MTAGTAPPDNTVTEEAALSESSFARPRQSWVSMVDIAYNELLEAISEGRLGWRFTPRYQDARRLSWG